jgi:23S rRNA (pseudouridine1915-N3)-methyltransferase
LRAKLGDDYLVTLDVQGREVSTEMIAERFGQWQMEGRRVGIVIGGPDGLHDSILKASQEQWSFGRITMPHPLVRVILSEQIYRAWSVQTGHPYHRAN